MPLTIVEFLDCPDLTDLSPLAETLCQRCHFLQLLFARFKQPGSLTL